jgi:phage shock protein PspC (stress-responsive transcriptional regulator)
MNIDLNAIRTSTSDRQFCGVCGGLGEHTPVPAWLWRVAFVLLACWHGYGVGAYLVIALFMPPAAKQIEARDTRIL